MATPSGRTLVNGYYHYDVKERGYRARVKIMPIQEGRKLIGAIPPPISIMPFEQKDGYLTPAEFRKILQSEGFANFNDLGRQVQEEFNKRVA